MRTTWSKLRSPWAPRPKPRSSPPLCHRSGWHRGAEAPGSDEGLEHGRIVSMRKLNAAGSGSLKTRDGCNELGLGRRDQLHVEHDWRVEAKEFCLTGASDGRF